MEVQSTFLSRFWPTEKVNLVVILKQERVWGDTFLTVECEAINILFEPFTRRKIHFMKSWIESIPKLIQNWNDHVDENYLKRWLNFENTNFNRSWSKELVYRFTTAISGGFNRSDSIRMLIQIELAYTLIMFVYNEEIPVGKFRTYVPLNRDLVKQCTVLIKDVVD